VIDHHSDLKRASRFGIIIYFPFEDKKETNQERIQMQKRMEVGLMLSILFGAFCTLVFAINTSCHSTFTMNDTIAISGSKLECFNRTLDGGDSEYASSIWGDSESLYTCGSTRSEGAGEHDLLLVKWSLNGTQVWNRTWGGVNHEFGYCVWGDGSVIYTCGSTSSFGVGNSDIMLVKWLMNGTQVWNVTWGGWNDDYGSSIWGNGDAIFICGGTSSFGKGFYDLLLLKYDSNGTQAWNATWGGTNMDNGYSIWGNSMNIFTCGYSNSIGDGSGDMIVVKWNLDGDQIQNFTWASPELELGVSLWGDDNYLYTH